MARHPPTTTVLWKPPGSGSVAWHQDSTYISDQFVPRDNVSCTVWIALEDADDGNGAPQYCPGSHLWPRSAGGVGLLGMWRGLGGGTRVNMHQITHGKVD